MVCIAISQAAFEAIAKTLPVGSGAMRTRSTRRASGWSGFRRTWSTGCAPSAARARATATSYCGWRRRAA